MQVVEEIHRVDKSHLTPLNIFFNSVVAEAVLQKDFKIEVEFICKEVWLIRTQSPRSSNLAFSEMWFVLKYM